MEKSIKKKLKHERLNIWTNFDMSFGPNPYDNLAGDISSRLMRCIVPDFSNNIISSFSSLRSSIMSSLVEKRKLK